MLSYRSPSIIAIELLAQCNLYCSFCVRNASYENKSIFSLTQFEVLLKQVLSFPFPPALAFTGGEPFLLKNIFDYCQLAMRDNLLFSITTNGTIHRWDLTKKISMLPNFKHFIVSLDSANEDIHNYIRKGKDAYKKTIKFLSSLKEMKIPFCINMTVNENRLSAKV